MFSSHHLLYTNQLKWITPVKFRIHLLPFSLQCTKGNHNCPKKGTHHTFIAIPNKHKPHVSFQAISYSDTVEPKVSDPLHLRIADRWKCRVCKQNANSWYHSDGRYYLEPSLLETLLACRIKQLSSWPHLPQAASPNLATKGVWAARCFKQQLCGDRPCLQKWRRSTQGHTNSHTWGDGQKEKTADFCLLTNHILYKYMILLIFSLLYV